MCVIALLPCRTGHVAMAVQSALQIWILCCCAKLVRACASQSAAGLCMRWILCVVAKLPLGLCLVFFVCMLACLHFVCLRVLTLRSPVWVGSANIAVVVSASYEIAVCVCAMLVTCPLCVSGMLITCPLCV